MAKLHPMVSLELDDEDQLDMVMPIPMPERLRFPPGARFCLTTPELDKLEVDGKEAFVGGLVHFHAMARVTSVSMNDTEGGENCRIEFQIEDMAIPEFEDAENTEFEKK